MRALLRCPTFRTGRSLMRQRIRDPECRRSESGRESGPSGSGEFWFEAEAANAHGESRGLLLFGARLRLQPRWGIQPGKHRTVAGVSPVTRLPQVSLIFLLYLPDTPKLTRSVHPAEL
jgi:hypothetical protein